MTGSNAKTGTAPRRTAEERKEAIISAARTLFAKNGFHGTGMAEIAKVSGVLVGQIYRDFSGKEDIIAAIVGRDFDQIMNDQELADPTLSSDRDRFKSWVHNFVSSPIDPDALAILADILSEAGRNPRILQIVQTTNDRFLSNIAEAARLVLPGEGKQEARFAVADGILTASGALLHRDLLRLPRDPAIIARIICWVDEEITRWEFAE